nr:CAP domain-containing protein [uncultured Oscillibacter sp.]
MKRFKRDMSLILAGMALGAVLSGGVVAAGITAEPAWSPIYVDGQKVQMTAYNILGNNYVKLRDIGQAVGFNVYYQNGVQVDSGAPYTGEAPTKAIPQLGTPTPESLQVSSMKGTELAVGERSSLLVSPAGTNCTSVSSNPSVAALEQVAGYWVVVAQAPGSATITVTNSSGESGSLAFTVKADVSIPTEIGLNDNMEIRLEMVRLINEVRRENGLTELFVSEALMNAAQDCSTQHVSDHRPYDYKILPKYGWPYGASYNLAILDGDKLDKAAPTAISLWVNSPGHLQTMLEENATCVGTGISVAWGRIYSYMVVGSPKWANAYT